jgi:hypothetical protein
VQGTNEVEGKELLVVVRLNTEERKSPALPYARVGSWWWVVMVVGLMDGAVR